MGGIGMNAKGLESVEYAAKRLNITEQRAYQLAREGILPEGVIVRLGRQIRIDPDELEKFIRGGGQALPGGWKKEAER
jgi:excisionase family DNA binding protein